MFSKSNATANGSRPISRHKKLTDAAILGCIKEYEQGERSGPTQREIASALDVSLGTIQDNLKMLIHAGEVEKSNIRGYITKGATRRVVRNIK